MIDVTFPGKMFRLQSRPRYAIFEGEGKGVLSSADYDDGFISKYEEAYKLEIAAFLKSVAQGAMPDDEHMKTCVSAAWMARMAMDASEGARQILFRDYGSSNQS